MKCPKDKLVSCAKEHDSIKKGSLFASPYKMIFKPSAGKITTWRGNFAWRPKSQTNKDSYLKKILHYGNFGGSKQQIYQKEFLVGF
jgi:hypothetical protein